MSPVKPTNESQEIKIELDNNNNNNKIMPGFKSTSASSAVCVVGLSDDRIVAERGTPSRA